MHSIPATSSSTQTANAAHTAPTLVTQGIAVGNGRGVRVTVSAESTRTLSGAGTLKAFYWHEGLARWSRNTGLDLTVDVTIATSRDQTFPDQEVISGQGRIYYAADTVTVSGGTTVVLTLEAV